MVESDDQKILEECNDYLGFSLMHDSMPSSLIGQEISRKQESKCGSRQTSRTDSIAMPAFCGRKFSIPGIVNSRYGRSME
jgi:hypothetical protein